MNNSCDGKQSTIEPEESAGFVCDILGRMPAETLIDETALAISLHVTKRTVRRPRLRRCFASDLGARGYTCWP